MCEAEHSGGQAGREAGLTTPYKLPHLHKAGGHVALQQRWRVEVATHEHAVVDNIGHGERANADKGPHDKVQQLLVTSAVMVVGAGKSEVVATQ